MNATFLVCLVVALVFLISGVAMGLSENVPTIFAGASLVWIALGFLWLAAQVSRSRRGW